jgi:hypothetical protein
VEARGVEGFGQAHRRQHGREPPRQRRLDVSQIPLLRHISEIRLSIHPWLAASQTLTKRNSRQIHPAASGSKLTCEFTSMPFLQQKFY